MAESKRDWSLIIFGIIVVLCGCAIWLTPRLTLVSIAMFVGVLFLVAGVGGLISYVRTRKSGASGWDLAYAVLDIIVGLMMLTHLAVSAAVVPWLVGFCFVALGVFQIAVAISARKAGAAVWAWPAISGAINLLFGALFFIMPQLLAVWIAVGAIFRGVSMIVSGFTTEK